MKNQFSSFTRIEGLLGVDLKLRIRCFLLVFDDFHDVSASPGRRADP